MVYASFHLNQPGALPGAWQHFAPVMFKPGQESITHSKLWKQSLSVLQPPCRIPHRLLGVQHIESKVDSLKKQFSLLSNLQVSPTLLLATSDSLGTNSEMYHSAICGSNMHF